MASSSSSISSRVMLIRYWRPCSTTSVMASVGSSSSRTRGREVGRKSSSDPASDTRLNLLMRTSGVIGVQDFLSQLPVGVRPFGRAGVLQDRDRRQWRFGETNRIFDREVVDKIAEVLAHQLEHLLRVQRARFEDGWQDTGHLELRVEFQPHPLDASMQLLHTLQTEVFALEWDDHLVGGHEGVDGDQAQRGRAIYDHKVELALDRPELLFEDCLPADLVQELALGPGELDVGRSVVDADQRVLEDDLVGGHAGVDQQVVDGPLEFIGHLEPHVDAEMSLRVEIDEQHALFTLGQRGAQVHGRGGLTHPTFLVGDRNRIRHASGPSLTDRTSQSYVSPLLWIDFAPGDH